MWENSDKKHSKLKHKFSLEGINFNINILKSDFGVLFNKIQIN